MTNLEKLKKQAEEEGVDLSELSPEEAKELAEEMYGELPEGGREITKEEFELADFMGQLPSVQAKLYDALKGEFRRTVRFIVCIDVLTDIDSKYFDSSSLKEEDYKALETAYGQCYKAMANLPDGVEWESSDEAYWPDGEEVGPDTLSQARVGFLDKHLNIKASIYYESEEGAEQHLLGSCIYAYGTDPATMEAELYSKYWDERLTAASCTPIYKFRDEE